MVRIKWDSINEYWRIDDPEREKRFVAFADSARAIVWLRKLWPEIVEALSIKEATTIRLKNEYVTIIPVSFL